MSTTPVHLTPCNYLFGKETNEVFPQSKYSPAFLNESLETLMKINAFLISKKEALFLFDPTAFNNQCHLYALMVAQKKADERCLHLILFLSYGFLTDSSLLGKISEKASKKVALDYPTPKKAFDIFLKDPGGERTRASRVALVALFEAHLKKTLSSEENALYKELYLIAKEDLQLPPISGSGTLYTFPKFAGVVYLIDAFARAHLTLLFKVKVMTTQGNGSFTYCSFPAEKISEETALIVFEMVATDEKLTYLDCRELAKKCPHHSQRHPRKADRHSEEERCLFCTDKRVDVKPYQERILPILSQMDRMLYALGADFVLQEQKPFLSFFSNTSSFPLLTELFHQSVPYIEKFNLSMHAPLSMTVAHVYTDCKTHAFDEALIIDASYEQHLRTRGLL